MSRHNDKAWRRGAWVAALALASGLARGEARAQDVWSRLHDVGVSGSLRAGYWSSTRDLDASSPQFGSVAWGKATRELTPHVKVFVEGWAALRGPPDDTKARAEAREVYVDLRFGRLDARVGRQIVAWGRADGINPTDNVTPRDYTIFVPDDADRRVGTTGARASWYQGNLALTALWLPEHRPNRVSLPTLVGTRVREHHKRWPGETWGLRAERTGGTVDWSLSFVRGRDLQPDLGIGQLNAGGGELRLDHHRVWVAGADAAMNLGRSGLRVEAAYMGTEDDHGLDLFTKNNNLFLVLGTDRTFGERLNVNVQYLSRYVRHFRAIAGEDPGSAVALQGAIFNSQAARVQHGATARVRHTWRHETVAAELASTAWFGPRGIALLPKASYAITDRWKLLLGGEAYRGDARSVLGVLRRNSVAYSELRLEF